jgi:5-methylcytosine-specific restriction endonuclease McrA
MARPRRSTTTKDRHRRRQPPRQCAQCATTGVRLFQDHIVNLAAGGDDQPGNMQWLCGRCHHVKSERERLIGLRAFHAKRWRETEAHPGKL